MTNPCDNYLLCFNPNNLQIDKAYHKYESHTLHSNALYHDKIHATTICHVSDK